MRENDKTPSHTVWCLPAGSSGSGGLADIRSDEPLKSSSSHKQRGSAAPRPPPSGEPLWSLGGTTLLTSRTEVFFSRVGGAEVEAEEKPTGRERAQWQPQ